MATFTVKSKSNAAQFVDGMTDFGKQFKYANAVALTKTAIKIFGEEKTEIKRVFDRPTRWTQNSLYYKSAEKTDAKPQAIVATKDASGAVPAGRYLNPNIEGGDRRAKSHELRVFSKTIPGDKVKLNQYGNIPGSVYTKIISDLRVSSDPYQNQPGKGKRVDKRRGKKARFFYSDKDHVVYERQADRSIMPYLIMVRSVNYRPRFPFYDLAERIFDKEYPIEFERALERALATAR
jgi:hypothetical protein